MDGTTYLGALVDADTDGQVASSDDANGTPEDEDGVGFVTTFKLGQSTTITIEASGWSCQFYRTENERKEVENFTFELHIETISGADTSGLMAIPYDPFILANTDSYHYNIVPPAAGKYIYPTKVQLKSSTQDSLRYKTMTVIKH